MPWRDLQELVAHLEKHDRLRRVSVPVSRDLEITEIADRVSKSTGAANVALLFERVEGFTAPVLVNAFGTEERMAWALGIERLDEQPYICHAASAIIVDIARIDRGALLRLNRLGIDAEAPSAHLSVDDRSKQDQEDRGGEHRPTRDPHAPPPRFSHEPAIVVTRLFTSTRVHRGHGARTRVYSPPRAFLTVSSSYVLLTQHPAPRDSNSAGGFIPTRTLPN